MSRDVIATLRQQSMPSLPSARLNGCYLEPFELPARCGDDATRQLTSLGRLLIERLVIRRLGSEQCVAEAPSIVVVHLSEATPNASPDVMRPWAHSPGGVPAVDSLSSASPAGLHFAGATCPLRPDQLQSQNRSAG